MDTSETMSVRMAAKQSFFARPEPKATPFDQIRAFALLAATGLRVRLSGHRKLLVGAAVVVLGLIGSWALAWMPRSSPTSTSDVPMLPVTPVSALPLEVGVPMVASTTSVSTAASAGMGAGARESVGVTIPGSSTGAPAAVVVGPTTPTVVVHAAGALSAPGVYRLADPARVTDVVSAAGGLTAEADPDVLNLAARVGDGERIYVPRRGQTAPGVVVGTTGVGSASGPAGQSKAEPAAVDLNAASAEQLDLLPGVGPAIATRILDHRSRIGRFRSVNQLLDVAGIGEAKFASLKSRVKV